MFPTTKKKMMMEIDRLQKNEKTYQQGLDLNDIYFYTYMEPNIIKKMKSEAYYIGRWHKI